MKKYILNIALPVTIIAAAVLAIGVNCGTPTPTLPASTCNLTAVSKFMTLYNSQPGTDFYSLDKQVYEYTFKTNVNGNICAIGYQGNVNLVSVPAYKMEIIDATTNVVLYSGNHAFNNAIRSYNSIPVVAISANQPYIIRRTVVNNLGDVTNTVSHFKQIPSPFTAIVNGSITILSTRTFEQYATAAPYNIDIDGVLPCIDFVFN